MLLLDRARWSTNCRYRAGCGGYVLTLDSLLELWRARAAAPVGVYQHVGVVASALRVVYSLMSGAVVLGAVGTALVRLAGVWRDRRQARYH
jgi:hypothetical protein